ncbi:MAG: hypothetical protein EOP52_09790 [Sphingobacteriales bacterium]|nr:MAG: hypothetical protein EOP52_09790 [Sphingobacteriales bacterium]
MHDSPNPPRKKAIRKTLALTALRVTVLYLAYHHLMLPKQQLVPREVQRGLWTSLKNAWKLSRNGVRVLRQSL